jgi:hypothetical protein
MRENVSVAVAGAMPTPTEPGLQIFWAAVDAARRTAVVTLNMESRIFSSALSVDFDDGMYDY